MGRILAIDFGFKRTGLASTDQLKIIASPLETIQTPLLFDWLKNYTSTEEVETIVVGWPTNTDMSDTHTTQAVQKLAEKLKSTFPKISIVLEDERFTSKMAQQSMLLGGMKKKDRRKKENVDKISATIILQSFMAKL